MFKIRPSGTSVIWDVGHLGLHPICPLERYVSSSCIQELFMWYIAKFLFIFLPFFCLLIWLSNCLTFGLFLCLFLSLLTNIFAPTDSLSLIYEYFCRDYTINLIRTKLVFKVVVLHKKNGFKAMIMFLRWLHLFTL